MEAPPIVILHRGDPYYLKYCLYQAHYTNPDSTVFLLGDESNQRYKGIKHYLISDYWEKAAQFTPVYQHRPGLTITNYFVFSAGLSCSILCRPTN